MFFERHGSIFVGRFAALFRDQGVVHGISTRRGGVSDAPYDALNLGAGSGDDPERVEENRQRFFSGLGVPAERAAIPKQVHGARIAEVTAGGSTPGTDGLVTNVPGIVLTVQVADCLPVLLYDPRQRAVGVMHAGWRGSAQRIAALGVERMVQNYGSRPGDLQAFLGPSIGPCCYEVGDEVRAQFPASCLRGNHLDLWQCNADQLKAAGVHPHRIDTSGLCTMCHQEWFFSHRGSGGRTGRLMAAIGLVA